MIKDFSIKTVEARKFVEEYNVSNVKISNKSMITDMTKLDEGLKIDFIFVVEYNPNLANIRIEGNLAYSGENSESILETWQEKEKDERVKKLQMSIVQRCIAESILLAKQINVPPPVPMPQFQKKEKQDYEAMFG